MRFDQGSAFARIIEEHLELKRRNSTLDARMPLDRYRIDDPFENHPLFKTEEEARLEETLGGTEPAIDLDAALAWPPVDDSGRREEASPEDPLWGRSRDFDWGD